MFSNVELNLEQMLPDLDALLEKHLFTKEELKQVLHKRSQFEYAVKSSTRTPEDFLKSELPTNLYRSWNIQVHRV